MNYSFVERYFTSNGPRIEMTMTRREAVTMALRDDALRLLELNKQVVRAIIEGDTDEVGQMLGTYWDLKTKLKQKMLGESALSVEDPTAREVLHKIGENVGLESDRIMERIKELRGDDPVLEELDEDDIETLGSELFYSWYSHYEYVKALGELRPLILQCEPSSAVKRLVDQVRQCYAFQQYDAAFGLCRTLLEASIRDVCLRRGLLPDMGEDAVLSEKLNWSQLRDAVSSAALNEKLKDLYGRLSKVLHARKAVTESDAREVFQETLSIIKEIYGVHEIP